MIDLAAFWAVWGWIIVTAMLWGGVVTNLLIQRSIGRSIDHYHDLEIQLIELMKANTEAHKAREMVMRGLVGDIITEYKRLHAKGDPSRPLSLQ